MDAALLRLTTGFATKARRIKDAIDGGADLSGDYKVIALSGCQITQQTPFSPSASGPVPDFVRAFLPIGSMYVRFPIGSGSDKWETTTGYHYSDDIVKPRGNPVLRTAFASDQFRHVDAVAYSPLYTSGLARPHLQVGVLHNPSSAWPGERPDLGMGNEYFAILHEKSFDHRRRRLPQAEEVKD
jgi:hypothetical protein